MRALVVGAGYLGERIIAALEAGGHELAIWVRTEASAARLGAAGHWAAACNLSVDGDVARAAAALPWQPGRIICCISPPKGGRADDYRATYLDGVTNLARVLAGFRLVFVSSTSVYGQTDGREVDESAPTEPAAETSRVLIDAERIVLEREGVVARLAGIYGPNRSVLLRKFLEGTARIEDGGGRVLNQIHRDDAAAALALLAAGGTWRAGAYNVADDLPMTQLEFYRSLSVRLDRPLPASGPRDEGRRRGWTSKRVVNAKVRAMGWAPSFPSWFDAFERGEFAGLLGAG